MGWPSVWVFVRHAESEGNVLSQSERTKLPLSTHLYRLTERGRRQAEITGAWLKEHFGVFDVYYSSYYDRAKETVSLMYPDARIYEDARLAEAQRGIFHVLSTEEIEHLFPWEIERKRREGYYHYRPWGGENWADVELRVHSFFGTIARDCVGLKVLTVVHGNWLVLARKLIHHSPIEEALREFEENSAANASVTIYRGVDQNGRSRLVPEQYNLIPWEGQLS